MIISCYIIEKETQFSGGKDMELIYLDNCMLKPSIRKMVEIVMNEMKGSNRMYNEYVEINGKERELNFQEKENIVYDMMYELLSQTSERKKKPKIKISRYHTENVQRNHYITYTLILKEYHYDKNIIKNKVNVMVRDNNTHKILLKKFVMSENEMNEIYEKYKETNTYLLIDFFHQIEMNNIVKIKLRFAENEIILKTVNKLSSTLLETDYLLYKKGMFNRVSEIIKQSHTRH